MKPLEPAAYSYWQHARRARRAIAAGDVAAVAEAVGMIVQIGRYAKAASLARACAASEESLRRLAVRHFGRVGYYTSLRDVTRIVSRSLHGLTPRDPSSPGAA